MRDLTQRLNISLIVITHNLGVVARYAHRVNVMYAARVAERGTADDIFLRPRHPYAMGLMRSVPRLDRGRGERLETIEGLPPNLLDPPAGCRFAARCGFKIDPCAKEPGLAEIEPGHYAACHRAGEFASGSLTPPAPAPRPPAHAAAAAREGEAPILSVKGLKKFFPIARATGMFARITAEVRAVNDVSFDIAEGETLGLVGESGCGKTTVGRLILRLETPTGGEIAYQGRDIAGTASGGAEGLRRRVQAIFQDPYSSLNPRMTVGQIIGEPLMVYRMVPNAGAAKERVAELLTQVGLFPYMAERYPHEMSGGQRQRVGIARALAMEPRFIVCDEPVSALDVSIQGQIINLLEELQQRLGLTYLFIAHDLAVVRHISDRVAVMYLGRIMELADRDTLYRDPLHPYTKALLDAAPVPDPKVERARAPRTLKGEIPSPLNPPTGCVFHTRCPLADEECRRVVPELVQKQSGHSVACIKVH
jgi:peptide/nickel transport system ATP-binding protein